MAGRYFEGRGVEKDHVKAALWMKKASEQGLAIARHLRADFLIAGVGTTPDSAAAMALYKSGAEDNYARSQMVYGGMLLKLAQSREERIESVKWLMLAMPSLEPSLARRVVRALKSPANPVKDPSEVQEAKARAKAFVISRQ